jgi:hypothetical protein
MAVFVRIEELVVDLSSEESSRIFYNGLQPALVLQTKIIYFVKNMGDIILVIFLVGVMNMFWTLFSLSSERRDLVSEKV